MTLAYSGFCEDVLVLEGKRVVPIAHKEFIDGSAYLELNLPPGSHRLTLLYESI